MTRSMLAELARVAANDARGVFAGTHPKTCPDDPEEFEWWLSDPTRWTNRYETSDSRHLTTLARKLSRASVRSTRPMRRLRMSRPAATVHKEGIVSRSFLIVALVAMLLGGCANRWPVQYRLDPSLTEEQRATYQEAVDRWNQIGQERLGHPVLEPGDGVDALSLSAGTCPLDNQAGCGGAGLGALIDWSKVPVQYRVSNATHEVGHLLGLYDLECVGSDTMCSQLPVEGDVPWPGDGDVQEFDRAGDR